METGALVVQFGAFRDELRIEAVGVNEVNLGEGGERRWWWFVVVVVVGVTGCR